MRSRASPPACTLTTLHYIDTKASPVACGQVCVSASKAKLIEEVLKASSGTCAATTKFTEYEKSQAVNVPIIGELTVFLYYVPSEAEFVPTVVALA